MARGCDCALWLARVSLAVNVIVWSGCVKKDSPVSEVLHILRPHVDLGVFRVGIDGERPTHTFAFTVRGTSPVRIKSIETDCGACSSPARELIGKELEPGSTHMLTLQMDVDHRAGPCRQMALITTDPPSRTPLVVSLAAFIVQPPVVSPSPLVVDSVFGELPECVVDIYRLRDASSRPLRLNEEASEFPSFVLVERSSDSGERPLLRSAERSPVQDRLTMRFKAATRLPIGEHRLEFRFAWRDDAAPSVLAVLVRVHHPVRPQVERVFFGQLRPAEQRAVRLWLQHTSQERPNVRTVMSDLDFVHSSINEVGDELVLKVRAPTGAGRFAGTVTISFENGSIPPLNLPVSGVVVTDAE